MKYFIFAVLFSFIVAVGSVSAKNYMKRSVFELYEQSDIVVHIEIIKGSAVYQNSKICGVRYLGRVKNTLKGSKEEFIVFGRNVGLKVGVEYLTFLKFIQGFDDYSDKQKKTIDYYGLDKDDVECRGIIPGYLHFNDGVFFRKLNGFDLSDQLGKHPREKGESILTIDEIKKLFSEKGSE